MTKCVIACEQCVNCAKVYMNYVIVCVIYIKVCVNCVIVCVIYIKVCELCHNL